MFSTATYVTEVVGVTDRLDKYIYLSAPFRLVTKLLQGLIQVPVMSLSPFKRL